MKVKEARLCYFSCLAR